MIRLLPILAVLFTSCALPATLEKQGILIDIHGDNFATGRSTHQWAIHEDSGKNTPLVVTEAHKRAVGKRVRITGTPQAPAKKAATKGASVPIKVRRLEVLSAAPVRELTATNVIFIVINFSDSPAPSTQAQVQDAVGTLASYFVEASYGRQALTSTVTTPVTINIAKASGCSYDAVGQAADAAATAAGYNVASFNYHFYVMPLAPCGWTGLGYVGYGRGWSNGANSSQVYGHELGHNIGLGHAGAVASTGPNIGVAEYGDADNTMGNRALHHYAALQKQMLGWLTATQVATYASGAQSYTLAPYESAGGALYAVKIPTPNANRTFWLEYRQAIGFDNALCAHSACTLAVSPGVQLRLGSPFESVSGYDDVEYLRNLAVGDVYTDAPSNISITVASADAAGAVVRVSTAAPPPPPPPPPPNAAFTNGSFETPALAAGALAYSPAGSGWVFSGAGLQSNGSGFGAATAPDGRQTAFVQGAGSTISQTVNLTAGNYTLAFKLARRPYSSTGAPLGIKVSVDGTQIGNTLTPASTSFSSFSVAFAIAADGPHTITFTGDAGPGDLTIFVDAVVLTGGGTPTPPTNPTTTSLATTTSYTATVVGRNPTGTVKFGALPNCQAVPLVAVQNVGGVASCTAPFSPGVTATYSGDAANAGSQSQ